MGRMLPMTEIQPEDINAGMRQSQNFLWSPAARAECGNNLRIICNKLFPAHSALLMTTLADPYTTRPQGSSYIPAMH